jgi:hypothetical protein
MPEVYHYPLAIYEEDHSMAREASRENFLLPQGEEACLYLNPKMVDCNAVS